VIVVPELIVSPENLVHAPVLGPRIIDGIEHHEEIKIRIVSSVAPRPAAEDEDIHQAVAVEGAKVVGDIARQIGRSAQERHDFASRGVQPP
jgi:hypothetical protein